MLAPPHRQQPNSPKMTRRATARRASWISNDYGDPKYGTKVPRNLSRFASHHPFFGMMCIYIYIIGIHMFEPFLYHMNIHRLTSTLLYWHADWTLCKGADTPVMFHSRWTGLVISLVLGPSEILLRSSSTKQVKQFGIVSAVHYGNLTWPWEISTFNM